MTYLYAKWNGDIECAELIEQKMESWATSGAYVRRSALRALVRNFSGVDLPPSFLDKTTFVSKNDSEYSEGILCAKLRAYFAFIRLLHFRR